MNEQLLTAAWCQVCDNILSLRKSDAWRGSHASFNDYADEVWNLSKTRAKLFCDFSMFSAMCREDHLRQPAAPDVVSAILSLLPKKEWLFTWQLCIERALDDGDMSKLTAKHIRGVMDFYGIGIRRRIPENVLKGRKVRAAAKTLAEIGDGEQLVEDIGVTGLGHDWDMGVRVAIDADQAKMDKKHE